jgi:PX domain-containing protein
MNICKRYSEFDDLRHRLMMTFPDFEAAVPPLPPKSVISKFRPSFLDKRRQGLQYFLKYAHPNPQTIHSPPLLTPR